jgi:hypothetical protein
MIQVLLIVVLVLLLLGGLPTWGWHHYGYFPSGLFGIILLIVVVWFVATRLK